MHAPTACFLFYFQLQKIAISVLWDHCAIHSGGKSRWSEYLPQKCIFVWGKILTQIKPWTGESGLSCFIHMPLADSLDRLIKIRIYHCDLNMWHLMRQSAASCFLTMVQKCLHWVLGANLSTVQQLPPTEPWGSLLTSEGKTENSWDNRRIKFKILPWSR